MVTPQIRGLSYRLLDDPMSMTSLDVYRIGRLYAEPASWLPLLRVRDRRAEEYQGQKMTYAPVYTVVSGPAGTKPRADRVE